MRIPINITSGSPDPCIKFGASELETLPSYQSLLLIITSFRNESIIFDEFGDILYQDSNILRIWGYPISR